MTRLLIVDDELSILEALQDVLSLEGYEVVTAYNGAEGLKRMSEAPPDLVLLDLMMPVMDGWELLRRMREDARLRAVPVVIMSAGRIGEEVRDAACATLPKPFDLDDLLETLAAQMQPKKDSA
jgi:CheY-like chemotaxis protein